MSETSQSESDTAQPSPSGTPPSAPQQRGLSRRTWTLVFTFALVLVLGGLGAFVTVPYVALGPGPTYDTLGKVGGTEVVAVTGHATYPTDGQLRMTTVSLTDDVTLFGALGLWLSGRYSLAPRDDYFKPGESEQQVEQENLQQFTDSQSNAEVAALRYLHFPIEVLAQDVQDGGPSDKIIPAGARLISVDGKTIGTDQDVVAALKSTKPDQTVPVVIEKDGKQSTVQLKLGKANDRTQGYMGITPIDHANVNFQIKISLSDIGGPSAGTMFALAIIDKLTPGDLNGGKAIAGTGEIDEKGNVKPIGGIPFKMVAAREAGATTFLVPADNCSEAKEKVPDGLRLVKISSLGNAVQELDDLKAGKPVPGC